jgi:hypothetical protein
LVTTFCFTAFIDKKFLARKYFITNSTENEHRLEKELLENAASPAKLTIKIVMSRLRLQQKNGGTQLATAIYVQNSGIYLFMDVPFTLKNVHNAQFSVHFQNQTPNTPRTLVMDQGDYSLLDPFFNLI